MQWIQNNLWGFEFVGIIVAILAAIIPAIIWLIKKYKIVKRANYKDLINANKSLKEENTIFKELNAKQEPNNDLIEANKSLSEEIAALKEQLRKNESGEDLFKDLQYDPNDNVWLKETANGVTEYYCPVCKTEKVRMPLDKHKDTIGNLFYCKRCNKPFGSGNFRPVDTEFRGIFD